MNDYQLAWRNECYGYAERAEAWEEYLAWLESQPADFHDSPPDNPDDNFPLPAIDDEPPF
jgi:hypothetical protein